MSLFSLKTGQSILFILNIIFIICAIIVFMISIASYFTPVSTTEKSTASNFNAQTHKNDLFLGNHQRMKDILYYIKNLWDNVDRARTDSSVILTNPEKNILLFGDAGAGKTHFIYKLSYYLEELYGEKGSVNLIEVRPSNILNQYFGSSEKNLSLIFDQLKVSKRKYNIIFFDEIDGLLVRNLLLGNSIPSTFLSEFQNILDGRKDLRDIKYVVIGTTNMPVKSLSPPIARRFLKKVHFTLPSKAEAEEIVDNFLLSYKEMNLKFNSKEEKEKFIKDNVEGKVFNESIVSLRNYFFNKKKETSEEENKNLVDKIF